MTTKTLTADEYRAKRRHDYAGTVRTLESSTVAAWKAAASDWDGKHWAMWNEGGAVLGPVNVR